MSKEKKTYKIKVVCKNCDYGEASLSMYNGKIITIEIGQILSKIKCPNCGCKTLIKWGRINE